MVMACLGVCMLICVIPCLVKNSKGLVWFTLHYVTTQYVQVPYCSCGGQMEFKLHQRSDNNILNMVTPKVVLYQTILLFRGKVKHHLKSTKNQQAAPTITAITPYKSLTNIIQFWHVSPP